MTSNSQELIQQTDQAVAQLRRRERMLCGLASGVGLSPGEDFWQSLMAALTDTLQVDYAIVSQICPKSVVASTLAAYGLGQPIENFDYDLTRGPYQEVAEHHARFYLEDVRSLFLQEPIFQDYKIEAYLGIALRNAADEILGLLVVLHRQPLEDLDFIEEVLSIFAARASAELSHQLAEQSLQRKIKQQSTLSLIGQLAATNGSLASLLEVSVMAIAQTLGAEYCQVLELCAEQQALQLKAAIGWPADLVGSAQVSLCEASQLGYTFQRALPVIVSDFHRETRFQDVTFLQKYGMVSGVSVVIPGPHGSYGVLAVHAKQANRFDREDSLYLQTIAALIGQKVEQTQAHHILRQNDQEYKSLAKNFPGIVCRTIVGDLRVGDLRRTAFLNDQCHLLTGFTPKELTQSGICSLDYVIAVEDLARVRSVSSQAIESQQTFQIEYKVIDKMGSVRYFWEKGEPVAKSGRQPAHIDSIIFDITHRKDPARSY